MNFYLKIVAKDVATLFPRQKFAMKLVQHIIAEKITIFL
jgi:hypothetical protein